MFVSKHWFMFVGLFLIMMSTACSLQKDHEMPGIDIPEEDMNTDLHLIIPTENVPITQGHPIPLVLENSSDETTIFSEINGIHIFQSIDDEWLNIENRMDYPSKDLIVYPKNNGFSLPVWTVVNPVIYPAESVLIRIVLIGNVFNGETNELGESLGTFIDINLEP